MVGTSIKRRQSGKPYIVLLEAACLSCPPAHRSRVSLVDRDRVCVSPTERTRPPIVQQIIYVLRGSAMHRFVFRCVRTATIALIVASPLTAQGRGGRGAA